MMKEIDQYVESLYRHVKGDREELKDVKDQMKAHLAEKVDELQSEGRTKEDSLAIAFENFGDRELLDPDIGEVIGPRRPPTIIILSVLHFMIGIIFIISSLNVLRNGITLGGVVILNDFILYGLLGTISAVGMWLGRRWGWFAGAFVYAYGILGFFQYLFNIPINVEQQMHFSEQHYFVKILYLLLFAVLSLVFWRKEIMEFYDVKNISWMIKIVILISAIFVFTYIRGYFLLWLIGEQ